MAAREWLIAVSSAAAATMLLARGAGAAEAVLSEPSPAPEQKIDAERFRGEIESHLRDIGEQLRITLSEDLRRGLTPKIVLAANELRTRS